MVAAKSDAYDDFSYLNYAYPQTHPDRMGSLAHLFGMDPAPVDNCRVLELGCGDGANLLPLAVIAPESEYVGIDRAKTPIANGQAMIQALELTNIKLLELDLTALPDALGQFDYIIAHGLYSWVPPGIRDAILSLCRSRLNNHGVAYISYNAYPGCHLRNIVRDAMRFHTSAVREPHERVAQGRGLIKWLAEAQLKENSYQIILREFNEYLQNKNEAAIFHDDLADINSPFYFREFVEQAAQHGLQFLSEAVYFDAAEYNFSPEVSKTLRELGQKSTIAKEQYLDLLEGKSFRQTLLCHQEHKLDRTLKPAAVRKFLISSQASPVSTTPNIKDETVEKFQAPHGASISTGLPLAKAALLHLSEIYPRSVAFKDLLSEAQKLVKGREETVPHEEEALAEILRKAHGANVVDLHLYAPPLATTPGERPLASPLVRLQASQGVLVTSMLHHTLRIEDVLGRRLLCLLDGTRDRETLIKEFGEVILNQAIAGDGQKVKEGLLAALPSKLEEKLGELARLGFLMASTQGKHHKPAMDH